jgi:hypothetical protein
MANEYKPIPDDFDRDQGIFTPRDRRFLAGFLDEDLSDNERRVKRHRLRKRIIHTLQDLAYLRLMSTEDMGQIAESFGYDESGSDAPLSADYGEEGDMPSLLASGAIEVTDLAAELFGYEYFLQMFTDAAEERAALDHYEETGRFGVFRSNFEIELVEEMSIEEAKDLVEENVKKKNRVLPEYQELPPNIATILELEGWERPRDPTHPELSETAEEVIEDCADDSGTAKIETVLSEVEERAEVSRDIAREAYYDVLRMGHAYEVESDQVRLV